MANQQTIAQCDSARQFYFLGWQFHEAYTYTKEKYPNMPDLADVKLFLLCRALEEHMKGWLVLKGLTEKKLKDRNYGHQLSTIALKVYELYGDAEFSHKFLPLISYLNDAYSQKDFEYPVVQGQISSLRDLEALEKLVVHCQKRLDPMIEQARRQL